MTERQENAQKIRNAIEYLRPIAKAEKLHMNSHIVVPEGVTATYKLNEPIVHPCGSACCGLGWLATMYKFEEKDILYDFGVDGVYDLANILIENKFLDQFRGALDVPLPQSVVKAYKKATSFDNQNMHTSLKGFMFGYDWTDDWEDLFLRMNCVADYLHTS